MYNGCVAILWSWYYFWCSVKNQAKAYTDYPAPAPAPRVHVVPEQPDSDDDAWMVL
jgi:hypothetical protein